MSRIAVIDHGAGNLVSIAQSLEWAGADVTIAERASDLAGAHAVVLPGVGATGAAMRRLEEQGLVGPLRAWDRPLLGVCVGLQLFFEESAEHLPGADGAGGGTNGGRCLGLVEGRVEQLAAERLPHIGWNELSERSADEPLFAGIPAGATFYFVHSYAPVPTDPGKVIALTTYGVPFVSAVRDGARVGVQFHPERSGRHGLRLISNFVRLVAASRHAA